ncbi:MAG TPA: R3H domain-containing nucleic acid-binding protein [Candidatus Cybelea sp.]|jgi:spoIIIJ-associated protein|nr:R3H domain-containing nucleic acid-binding protein [Candidatus Cybelea sp.]
MLYEDDFEFEEQPADVRDRTIGGRPGGGRGGGGGMRRRREPRRGTTEVRDAGEIPEDAKPARDLLREILSGMGAGPVEIGYVSRPEGEYLEVTGPHLGMLIGRHGNTLEALNLIFNNAFNAGVRANRRYYTIDAEGYRAHRADQLKHLALATLDQCVREGKPQRLEPMLPSERKIVHLAIASSELVRTESEGEEPERRVVIHPR